MVRSTFPKVLIKLPLLHWLRATEETPFCAQSQGSLAIIGLYHLGYAIGSKDVVELRDHRFDRSRVDALSLRKC